MILKLYEITWAGRCRPVLWVPLLLFFPVAIGCGDRSGRMPLAGAVTVDGQPLKDGDIEFRPLPGTASPSAGAAIVDGHYEVLREKGVFPGQYRVEIRAIRPSKRVVHDEVSDKTHMGVEQFLPAQYNEESELVAEVAADLTQYDFDLSVEPKTESP